MGVPAMQLVERFRTWWQVQTCEDDTPLDGDAPAWLVSFFVHLTLLLLVALLSFHIDDDHMTLTILAEEETIVEQQVDRADSRRRLFRRERRAVCRSQHGRRDGRPPHGECDLLRCPNRFSFRHLRLPSIVVHPMYNNSTSRTRVCQ